MASEAAGGSSGRAVELSPRDRFKLGLNVGLWLFRSEARERGASLGLDEEDGVIMEGSELASLSPSGLDDLGQKERLDNVATI